MAHFVKQPIVSAALILLAIGAAFATPSFQDKKPADQKPAPGEKQGGDKKPEGGREKAKPSDVALASQTATAAMNIPLSGVTAENSPKAEAAIQTIAHPIWKCAKCDYKQSDKGQCPKCKADLVMEKDGAVAVKSVSVTATTGLTQLALAPGQTIHLSEIDRALKPESISVNRRQLVVPNCARLLISAPTEAKEAEAAIQRALAGTKLFANATVHYNEHKKEFVALIESTGLATYADAAGALEACGPGYKVTDMAWTAPCASCTKAGCVQANCKTCWKDS
jgi:hypothetical protein